MTDENNVEKQVDALALQAQQVAEDHLEHLAACLMAEEAHGDENVFWPETNAPYCGCTTCDVRETLWIAYPFLKQIALLEGGHL